MALEQKGVTRLAEAYQEFDRALRVRQARVGYILALLLVPAGMTLDYFVYRNLFFKILQIRLVCDLALLPCILASYSRLAPRFARLIDKPCVLLPTIAICWMVYASEGAISPYYAGLNLMVVGACLLIPYTLREASLVCVTVILCYASACFLHNFRFHGGPVVPGLLTSSGTLFNNLYFLTLTSIICATACHYLALRRFDDFRLRHELDSNNTELQFTLRKLQDTEVQLVQSEKMNALGKLSAGLLHEVNNPLNFTLMALQIAEQEAEGNESLQDTLKDIGQGMTRIRGVVSDLRAFAYPSKGTERDPFDLDDALTTAMRLTAHEIGDLAIDRSNLKRGKVLGAKTQIVHVFMNLLVNSAQAIRSAKPDRVGKVVVSCVERGGRIHVSVRDNGTGVKASILPRLLDPFFTTKDVGKGMGLGLSICHTIIKNHGGDIKIASEEGKWTDVTFDLPPESAPQSDPGESTPAFTEALLETAGSTA